MHTFCRQLLTILTQYINNKYIRLNKKKLIESFSMNIHTNVL